MRKAIILPLVLFFAIGLSSCKKDWTCKCEKDDGDVYWSTISNTSKSDAEELCSSIESDDESCKLVGE